jgi:hypothetical protein
MAAAFTRHAFGTMGGMAETRITFCRICEATCGLEVDVEDNRVLAIRPDTSRTTGCWPSAPTRSTW